MADGDLDARLESVAAQLNEARISVQTWTTIGRRLARDAVDEGMSEVEVARRLGVSRMTVRKWLGKGRP